MRTESGDIRGRARRRRAYGLVVAALVLAALRLSTGIYYRADSAGAYLVLKTRPDWAIERSRVDDATFDRAWVLDQDELDLAYGRLYRDAMGAVPIAALVLLGAALASHWRGIRPIRSR